MKRYHLHVSADSLNATICLYSSIFGAAPSVVKGANAKWILEDRRVNFAASTRGDKPGVNHLGNPGGA